MSSLIRYTFKDAWTGETVKISLNPEILISDIKNNISIKSNNYETSKSK